VITRANTFGIVALVTLTVLFFTLMVVTDRDDAVLDAGPNGFLSVEDLEQFAGIVNRSRAAGDWEELRRSLLPGTHESCTLVQLGAVLARGERADLASVERSVLSGTPGHSYFVGRPPAEWRFAGADIDRSLAVVERTATVYGQPLTPAVTAEERWVASEGSWWLEIPNLDRSCRGVGDQGGGADDLFRAVALDANSFRRPAPIGAALMVDVDGAAVRLELARAVRGDALPVSAPPAPTGFENVFVEVRVESVDNSGLTLPLAFWSASFDGFYYDGGVQRGLHTCLSLDTSERDCLVFTGLVQVSADDPAPRLAWVPTPAQDAPLGELWWWLPGVLRDGEPLVRTVASAVVEATLAESGIDRSAWDTDFTRQTVDLGEVLATGVGRDGIAAIRAPKAESIADADRWLVDREPVQIVEVNGEVRAYPLQIVIRHEIVNDTLGGEPVLVTYCPLCNTALSFERRVGIRIPEFGTTGTLRISNLVMYDSETESFWQQATGDAIAGELAGSRLRPIPSRLTSWGSFKAAHPDGTVLSRDTGFDRDYGVNLYLDYDQGARDPDFFNGVRDGRLALFARVLGVRAGGEAIAFPFGALAFERVVQREVGGTPVVVFYQDGTASALDTFLLSAGRDVGAAAAYEARADGRRLTFREESGRFLDDETGSAWDLLGQAVDGPLAGTRLDPLFQDNGFWFSWVNFNPDTTIYEGAASP
jgi:hypothetical protein